MTQLSDNPFADLGDDLDSAATRGTLEDRPQFPCLKCSGTGVWTGGYVRVVKGKCHACKGRGYFLTSPEYRAKSRAGVAKRKVNKVATWIESNTELWDYFNEVSDWNDFASSLKRAVEIKGELSDKQEAAAHRALAKHKTRKAAEAERVANPDAKVELTRINDLFQSAREASLKRPILRVETLALSLAPASGKNAGFIYVKNEGEYAGKISPEGEFFSVRNCPQGVTETLESVASDPEAALKAHGIRTGNCACCNRELTNQESLDLGIGPICYKKWGLG